MLCKLQSVARCPMSPVSQAGHGGMGTTERDSPGTTGATLKGAHGHSYHPYSCDLVPTTGTRAPPCTARCPGADRSGHLGGPKVSPTPAPQDMEPTAPPRPLRGKVLAESPTR